LAVNRNYKDASGADREQTSFIDCSAWGKAGEIIAQYSKKGSAILVSGRLDQRSWEDKETKQKRSKIEVVVEDFSFLGGKDGGSSAGGGRSSSSADVVPDDIDADEGIDLSEIPF
jgi:single-strand DNA-binding protein